MLRTSKKNGKRGWLFPPPPIFVLWSGVLFLVHYNSWKSMQCPICSATFAEPQALEQHVYRCLDAQDEQDRAAQLSKDEELARQLHSEQERSASDHSSSSRSRAPRCNLQPADFASSASDLWMSFNLPSRSTKIRANPFPGKPQSSLISKLVVDETQTLLYKCGMKEDLMELLEERHQLGDLALLYKNTVHGNSISTLYSCVNNDWPLVILIEDSNHCVFGCFLSHPLKSQGKKATGFKGTGEVSARESREKAYHISFMTILND